MELPSNDEAEVKSNYTLIYVPRLVVIKDYECVRRRIVTLKQIPSMISLSDF